MKNIIFLIILVLSITSGFSQDAHFSQAWNNSAQLNPALTGVYQDQLRAGIIYRTQWTGIPEAAYKNYGIFADVHYNGFGFGLTLFNENAGFASMKSTSVRLNGAYHQRLGEGQNRLSVGLSTGFLQKRIDPSSFTFDKQYDSELGVNADADQGEFFANTTAFSPDLSIGLEWVLQLGADQHKALTAGLSLEHLNSPSYTILTERNNIPMLWTAYGKMDFPVLSKAVITPKILIRRQETASEFLLGIESTLKVNEDAKVNIGLASRFKDALIVKAGVEMQNVFAGLSYDINTSGLASTTKGNGAVELLITYRFNTMSQAKKTMPAGEIEAELTAAPQTKGDRDGDGVPDLVDECPDLPGFYRFQGCTDKDEDGIWDTKDRCPNLFGAKENGGCPMKVNDIDGDGIIDDFDQCVYIKGLPSLNGCPDSDRDGISDSEDHCPYLWGEKSSNGCPAQFVAASPQKSSVAYPRVIVEFDTDQSLIRPVFFDQLNQAIQQLKAESTLSVVISGHTDFEGSVSYNFALSQRRSFVVQDYLVSHGIHPSRIQMMSYGETMPKDSNATTDGKARNRRVELILLLN